MKKADRIYYGGDYNPDQWDDQTIDEDMRLFKKAGINLLTLPVFHGQSLSQTRVFIISNGWTESLIKFGKWYSCVPCNSNYCTTGLAVHQISRSTSC